MSIMICPECGIGLEETNFIVMAFLTGDLSFWCPECGYEWEFEDAISQA